MKHSYIISIFLLAALAANAQITGMWKTIGDQDGTEKSIVEIYEKEGK